MIAFVPLYEAALDKVLEWRTNPEITRYLCTDIEGDPDQQRQWFARVSADSTVRHWLIRHDQRDIGLANLKEIDLTRRSCSCGFIIGEKDSWRFGGVVLPGIVNHVFGVMDFHKIQGEVLAGNTNVLNLHDLLGYRQVGIFREHIFKYGSWHDLHLFELMRTEWEARQDFYRQFRIPVLDDEGGQP